MASVSIYVPGRSSSESISAFSNPEYGIENDSGDFNNDGYIDILSNGSILLNNGDFTFDDVSDIWGLSFNGYSNGSTYSDLDNDGDLDLILNNINSDAKIYSNRSNEFYPNRNFINLKFEGEKFNSNGIGSKITIWSDNNTFHKENFVNKGFLSSTSPELFFGLNDINMIDSLQVRWSTGKIQNLYSIKVNQELILYEKDAEMEKLSYKKIPSIFSDFTDKVTPKIFHKENIFNDFNKNFIFNLVFKEPCVAQFGVRLFGYKFW